MSRAEHERYMRSGRGKLLSTAAPGGARIHAIPKNKRISKMVPSNGIFTIIHYYRLLFIAVPPVFTSLLYRSGISLIYI